MAESIRVWLKKIFSLTLILNALITLSAIIGIMYGFYHAWPYWKPYAPYLINGNLFIVVGIAALINIFPSASIGAHCIRADYFSITTSTASSS